MVGIRGDQDIDGIADHVHTDEDDNRHRQDNKQRLDEAPQKPSHHVHACLNTRIFN
ncbi:hypothetical protein [Chelatococcus asaccharovorans]|uniref:hypothetical protein n=1 Tax=Chelatococcus asaccharovorans TaxID=28210 RepID=UPI001FE1D380|nr:hypothetical protein [Chelatococcus asaccharovorans]